MKPVWLMIAMVSLLMGCSSSVQTPETGRLGMISHQGEQQATPGSPAISGVDHASDQRPTNSGDGHLVVRVRSGERGDNHPISGAKVTVREIPQSLMTDERGLAAFGLPVYIEDENFSSRRPAYYTLSVELPGFTTETYRDVHAFESPLTENLVDSTLVDVFMVRGGGENVHQSQCLDGDPPPCSVKDSEKIVPDGGV